MSALEFLSPDWFQRIADGFAPVHLDGDPSASFELAVDGSASHLVVDAGRVTALGPGARPDADLRLSWSADDAMRIAWGLLDGTEAMARTTARGPDPAVAPGPPAPDGLTRRAGADALPRQLGVTIRVQFVHPGGPFGTCAWILDLDDGRIRHEGFEMHGPEAVDVTVTVTYENVVRIRNGWCTTLEALQGGAIDGDIGAMIALAGILETPEFDALLRVTGEETRLLGVFAALRRDPVAAAAFDTVMRDTKLP